MTNKAEHSNKSDITLESSFDNFSKMAKEQWQRAAGGRPLVRQVYISCEGVVTEPEYFEKLRPFLKDNYRLIIVRRERSEVGHSAPPHILRKLEDYRRIRHIRLDSGDEQWLVFDVDSWTPDQFEESYRWAASRRNNFLAISNPDFEFWLLLHFEDPADKLSSQSINAQLRYYIPEYNKHVHKYELTSQILKQAMDRARKRHWIEIGKFVPPKIAASTRGRSYLERWEKLKLEAEKINYEKIEEMAEAAFPTENGSTVYLLVEHLVGENPSTDAERVRVERTSSFVDEW